VAVPRAGLASRQSLTSGRLIRKRQAKVPKDLLNQQLANAGSAFESSSFNTDAG
jgi:hypothetical protein